MNHTTDPVDLKRQLQELQYSDERYRIAAENSSEIILDYNLKNDSIHHVTGRVTEIYGIPQTIEHAPEYLVRCGAVQPESAADFLALFRQLHAGEQKVSCILKTKTVPGDIRWAEVILTAITDITGVPVRAIGVLKDITLQREAELQYANELQHREAMIKDALLYYEADLTNHKIVDGLDGILRKLSLSPTDDFEAALDILIQNVVYTDDQGAVHSAFNAENLLQQHARGVDKVELVYRRFGEDGNLYWVRGTAYMAEDKTTGVVKAYYSVVDINEAKLRELSY